MCGHYTFACHESGMMWVLDIDFNSSMAWHYNATQVGTVTIVNRQNQLVQMIQASYMSRMHYSTLYYYGARGCLTYSITFRSPSTIYTPALGVRINLKTTNHQSSDFKMSNETLEAPLTVSLF